MPQVVILKNRFDQPGYQLYSNLEQLLIKACQGKTFEEQLQFKTSFYKDDLDKELLQTQLFLLAVHFKLLSGKGTSEITISILGTIYIQTLSSAQRGLLDQVCVFLLPARASEQGNVIGLVSLYIYMSTKTIVIERTRVIIYLKFVATDFSPNIISPSAGKNSSDSA